MIRATDITKVFDNVKILDNVSLEVSNELIAILGPTGEGKTVLLKIIAGLVTPDSGQVSLDNNDSIGFVFQHSSLFDSLTVEENIWLPLEECSNLKNNEIQKKVESVVSLLDIDNNLLKKRSLELSGGERKIVAIGRAIINNPTYVFYDEPTTGLDPTTHERICNIIRNLNKPGIVVTHNMDTIKTIKVGTIFLLKSGKLDLLTSFGNEGFKKERYE